MFSAPPAVLNRSFSKHTKLALLLLVGATVFNFLLIYALYQGWTDQQWIMIHVVAVLMQVEGTLGLLPPAYRINALGPRAFLWSLSLPMPILGQIFLLIFARIARSKRHIPEPEPRYVYGNDLETLSTTQASYNIVRRSIIEVLNSSKAEDRRRAVWSTKMLKPHMALPVLKKAIRDSDEHVRLFAQSILQDIISRLEESLKDLEREWNRASDDTNQALSLAEQYQEMVYLNLVGDLDRSNYVRKAIGVLNQIVKREPQNTRALFLLVRYHLYLGDEVQAKEALEKIAQTGMKEESLLPWLAEIYFLQRDWKRVKDTLTRISVGRSSPNIARVRDFWIVNPSV